MKINVHHALIGSTMQTDRQTDSNSSPVKRSGSDMTQVDLWINSFELMQHFLTQNLLRKQYNCLRYTYVYVYFVLVAKGMEVGTNEGVKEDNRKMT